MLRTVSGGSMADVLGTTRAVATRVDAWRANRLLAQDVPILSGTWSEASDQQVQEAVQLEVPAVGADGRQWIPTGRGSDSPLGSDGHRLRITYTVPRGNGTAITCPLGWVRINDWDASDGRTLTLTGAGLFDVPNAHKLLTATSPPPGSTLIKETRRLLDGRLPLDISQLATPDRPAARTMSWTEDRLAALYEVAAALPAELRVDASGMASLDDVPGAYVPDLDLTEGVGGTIIAAGNGASRDGVSNVWVVRGEDSGDSARTPAFAVAADLDPTSPTYVGAYDPVVAFFSSPLLTTDAQCLTTARHLLAKSIIAATAIPVSTFPDPRIAWGTRIRLHRRDGRVHNTKVLNNTLPLTAGGGAQALTLGVVV